MGNSRQGQHQTVKAASSTNTASKQESALLREEPQELLTNQALGRVLQAQRKLPQVSPLPIDRLQRQSLRSSGFRGLSQELAQGRSQGGSQGLVVQPKLKLTKAGDRHEREADLVAAQVVKRINTDPIRKTEATKGDRIMPKAAAPTSAPTGTAVTPQFETTLQQQRGQGQAIPEDVREPLEEAFNADFRHVRVHTNEQSHQLNHSIQAIAFTTGTDIFFKQGAYQPRSRQGQELLAHELTHVVQQNSQKTAIQRKGAGKIQFSNEPFPEIAIFVQDVTQEIQSFSDTWLNSPPSEIEIFPWFKIVNPTIKMEQTTDNCSLDIQGRAELNFGSDLGNIQPKGSFKINYQSQSKKWDYKSENIDLDVTLAEIFQFKADDLQYSRADKALNIKQANLLIPQLSNANATVEKARIDSNGLDWDKVNLSAEHIALGSYVNINKPKAVINGAKDKYSSMFTGDFKVNLGKSDIVNVNGEGTLTVTYKDGKWGSTQKDVKLNGAIANTLNFSASDIQYDHENTKVSIGKADITIPELYNANATVEKARIDGNGLDWDNVTLNATDIPLGQYANINAVSATIGGASQEYASEFKGNFGANLGTDNLVEVKAQGQLTVKYKKGQWSCPDNTVSLGGTIAKVLNFDASNIQYHHADKKVTIGQASLIIPQLSNATATVEKARIDSNGLDWDKVNLSAEHIALGSYVNIDKPKAVINGAKDKYNSMFTGDFKVNLGKSDIVNVNGEGTLTVTYKDGKWGSTQKDVKLNGAIANILNFDANNIKYDYENTKISIGEASITIPKLDKAKATVENARIDNKGLDWDKVTLDVPKLKLGEYASISNVKTKIAGATDKYNSRFDGDFGVNLGSSELVKVEGKGHLTLTYQDGNWGCEHKDVTINGAIANILDFNASNIQYDHNNTKVSIGQASITIPKLNKAKATVENARIDSNGLDWDKVTLSTTQIALGSYVNISKPEAVISGAKDKYNSKFTGDFSVNLGQSDIVKVNGSGKLTVLYQDGKWGSTQQDVKLNGAIANILDFNASNIQYDHNNTKVSIGEASITIPKLDKAKATVENARIDSKGLDWDKVTLDVPKLKLGEYASISNVKTKIAGATDKYNSRFDGDFGVNLDSSELVKVEGKGHLTLTYQDGNWGCEHKDVGINGAIANILDFNASNIQYDHNNTKVSIGEASITIPKLNKAKATVENARIDSNGLDWDKVTLDVPKLKLGEYASISNVKTKIAGVADKYNSRFDGDFGVNLGSSELVKVEGKGHLTLTYQDGNWGSEHKDVGINGAIANILDFNASNIQYDHNNTKVSIGEASITIPKLNKAKATVENARIDNKGLDWDKVTLDVPKLKLGEYASISNVKTKIAGATDKYNSRFDGDFGVNLGSSELVKVEGKGHLTLTYQDGNWGSEHKDVTINGAIANILDFNARDIQYDHENTKVSIGQASVVVPKLNDATATVEKARIDSNGLDWDKVNLSAEHIALGSYVNIDKPKAVISGAKDKYSSMFTGDFKVNLGKSDIINVNGEGTLTVTYKDGKWGSTQKGVKLNGAIANILDFNASDIQYDHENTRVSIGQAGITIPELYNATATVENARIDSQGLDWDKVKLSVTDIALGQYAKINAVSATIGGAKQDYASEFSGALGVNLGTSNLAEVNAEGQLTIKNVKGQWSCPNNSVSLKGTIADVLKFEASKIQYHHADKKVTIGQASITIQQLNDTKASIDNARIDSNGLDWDTIKAQTGDISLGTVLSIKKPALIVEGATSRYSTTVSGGVGLNFGKYLTAEGSGKIKLDRSQGSGKGKIQVEEAKLAAKGDITFPGDFFSWPNISFDYPIVPGVEAGLELGIKGGIGASLQGTIAKQAAQDWDLGVNPEIHGFLGVDLKAKVGVGSAYIAAIQAFVSGGCDAAFNGGLELNGSLKYDEETKKVDATKLTSKYYANAEFKASLSAGVQAQALYFFSKDLYRIRAKCSLGAGKLEGKLVFDENGGFRIEPPKFSGVIGGTFDKTSIKLEEQSYELIKDADADAILKDAAQKIAGSGKKREEIINAVKAGYIRSLDEAKQVINKETEKSEKYIKNLEKISIKIARYNELIKLAKDLEQEEDSVNSQETDLNNELENEETKLDGQLETEVETLVNEDKTHKEKSEHKRGFFSGLKSAAQAVREGKETLKNKLIPNVVRDKYHEIDDKYEKKKLKVKEAINTKRDSMRIKYDAFKNEKKESFASLKNEAREHFPKIADKASTIKSNASALTKKASSLKAEIKESIKEKTLIKLTELGIKDSQSFVKRIGQLTELQIKYSKKHEMHSNFLKSAIEAKIKAEKVLKDVEAAIANPQQLEEGTSMSKLTEMTEQEKAFMNAKNELHKEEVKLEDDLMKQIDDIEKEVAAALG
ncbi:DUF4157 domain-containing protein [Pseudanabaena sp. UWO310]|uniref:eCIS core domain-containing protein n=1 Tax=Pseudanabaena sp. UWO310 TaxID=2480795 RepID=UPI0011579C1E|nr:DUF4157 domain-containing protein [Pseudanabaena sp. UWO310]TYQ30983.1 DUF4157 domain-containing protein [Pseudanabaena sp. UWO310]